jgi:hypothetical protein
MNEKIGKIWKPQIHVWDTTTRRWTKYQYMNYNAQKEDISYMTLIGVLFFKSNKKTCLTLKYCNWAYAYALL